MRIIFCSTLLVFALSTSAQEPVPLAHGNVPGEPHHHLKIENEYVRAYYVEVPPHEATQLHQHDHDYIYVSLGPSDVVSAVLNKPEVHVVLKDGETHFTRGGFAHLARNLADTPFRNVTIELLKPQTGPYNLCGSIQPGGTTVDCQRISTHGKGYSMQPQFETSEIKLNLIRLDPGATDIRMTVQTGLLLTVLNDSGLEIKATGKPAVALKGGEMIWLGGASDWEVANPDKNPSSFLCLVIEPDRASAKP